LDGRGDQFTRPCNIDARWMMLDGQLLTLKFACLYLSEFYVYLY